MPCPVQALEDEPKRAEIEGTQNQPCREGDNEIERVVDHRYPPEGAD
jgi:hypothetical protein